MYDEREKEYFDVGLKLLLRVDRMSAAPNETALIRDSHEVDRQRRRGHQDLSWLSSRPSHIVSRQAGDPRLERPRLSWRSHALQPGRTASSGAVILPYAG